MPNSQILLIITELTHKMLENLAQDDLEQLLINQENRNNLLMQITQDQEFLRANMLAYLALQKLDAEITKKISLAHEELRVLLIDYYKGQESIAAYTL